MRAVRIHRFGSPDVIRVDDIERPAPGAGEVLVRVVATGVGPWDALIREGRSEVSPQPPLTLGSDLSGVIEAIGAGVSGFQSGDEIYGVTNPQFCGANAEYAIASAKMIARKPKRLNYVEAASAPVIAVTAWQMLFDYARVERGQRILILGAAGNVGKYALQMASKSGLNIMALVHSEDVDEVQALGAGAVVADHAGNFEDAVAPVDAVIDTVGGDARDRSFRTVKPGGIVVSAVSNEPAPARANARSVFFYVEVTTERLNTLSKMFDQGDLVPKVGSVLPLEEARSAHEMLAGAPHKDGKIVLQVTTK